jgi:hypothetical protein
MQMIGPATDRREPQLDRARSDPQLKAAGRELALETDPARAQHPVAPNDRE